MGNKLTLLALVIVFGLIVILGTLLVFQAWYNNVAPPAAEIQAVAHKVTKMNVDTEVIALNNAYNNSKSIEMAGRIIMIVEAIIAVLALVYIALQPFSASRDSQEDRQLQRAYEGY